MLHTLKVSTPSEREIVLTRTFGAPRQLVWNSFTTPALLKRWLFGPPGWEMTVCEEDLRPSGAFRWAWRGPNGEEMQLRGVYREVKPPERIVRTETFEFGCAAQAGEQIGTIVLTEQAGTTSLHLTLQYPSKEARDAAIASGMEHGMSAGYDRLDKMLASA
jgi:uncharacterized protein YndB with AHSA1/START domain